MPSKHRHSIRIKGYDYASPGAYFVTIVAYQRECLFGELTNNEMSLSDYGKIVNECWQSIPYHFPNVNLGAYIVMPNHVHGIIVIHDQNHRTAVYPPSVGARHASPLPPHGVKPKSLGAIVGSFKAAVTRRIGREVNSTSIWQRNYYEHIIRNEHEWNNIHLYIEANPANWSEDQENPSNSTMLQSGA